MSENMNLENNMQEGNTVMNNTENNNMEEGTMKSNASRNNTVKEETMTNENNRNGEGKILAANVKETTDVTLNNMVTCATFSDINEMIPEEEKEVSETGDSENTAQPVVVEIIEPLGDLKLVIPEMEREEIDKETYVDLKVPARYGCFSPVLGMRGFRLDTGHIFYARIFMDLKGDRWIEYCQQYSNSSFSAKAQIKQADLVIAGLYLYKAKNEEEKEKGKEKGKKEILKFMSQNSINKIIMKARNDYYNKAVFPQECVGIEQIFLTLLDVYKSIPTEKNILDEYEYPDRLYADVMNVIRKELLYLDDSEHKAYYAFNAEQIDMIANELKMKRDQLLKKLKEYKFLYLTDSSKGYQTCVRFSEGKTGLTKEFFPKSYTQWSYCILKLEYLANQLAKSEQK